MVPEFRRHIIRHGMADGQKMLTVLSYKEHSVVRRPRQSPMKICARRLDKGGRRFTAPPNNSNKAFLDVAHAFEWTTAQDLISSFARESGGVVTVGRSTQTIRGRNVIYFLGLFLQERCIPDKSLCMQLKYKHADCGWVCWLFGCSFGCVGSSRHAQRIIVGPHFNQGCKKDDKRPMLPWYCFFLRCKTCAVPSTFGARSSGDTSAHQISCCPACHQGAA